MAADNILNGFINVITCKKCREDKIASILNDNDMNIPQPGFVGKNYFKRRILFLDRNPGPPPIENGSYSEREIKYMKCLREIGRRDEANTNHEDIRSAFQNYFTNHHIYKRVFKDTNLSLDDVAIFNIVKCRTLDNRQPSNKAFENCKELHFEKWIKILNPKKAVYFGKVPYDKTLVEIAKYNLKSEFLNRERKLNRDDREKEITKIVHFIKKDSQELRALIDVEVCDLTDAEIEAALWDGRLRFGSVATSSQEAVSRQRRGQDLLRKLTLQNYETCCALCDVSDERLLRASHIVGWAEREETRGNLGNVICLCSFHDALFENGYWSLDDRLGIIIRSDIDSDTIRELLPAGCSFRKPSAHSPGLDFIRFHRMKHGLSSS